LEGDFAFQRILPKEKFQEFSNKMFTSKTVKKDLEKKMACFSKKSFPCSFPLKVEIGI